MNAYDTDYHMKERADDMECMLARFLKSVRKHGWMHLETQKRVEMRVVSQSVELLNWTAEQEQAWTPRAAFELAGLLDHGLVDFKVGFLGSVWQDIRLAGHTVRVGLHSKAEDAKHAVKVGGPWIVSLDPFSG